MIFAGNKDYHMKNLALLLITLLIISCSEKQHDLTVKVNIEGLKKGNVYLKKIEDSTVVNVDSITINGNSKFELHSNISSPEVFFLYLDKNSSENDAITFFADKGITEINASLKNFAYGAKINGSAQQKLLEEYNLIMSKFNERNLDLIKEEFDAKKEQDSAKINSFQKKYDNLLKLRYLSTVNFALNHKDSEVAPYLALAKIANARINFLDTINNSLTDKVKASKYGKELQKFINEIKASEVQ